MSESGHADTFAPPDVATLQFLTELVIDEAAAPQLRRVRQPDLYDCRCSGFEPPGAA